jgi:hypothetical protein
MTEFNVGDTVRMIGDETFTGTVTKIGRCIEYDGCDETLITFEDEHGPHSTHASDLEPA